MYYDLFDHNTSTSRTYLSILCYLWYQWLWISLSGKLKWLIFAPVEST